MTEVTKPPLSEIGTTSDERTMAVLAHVFQLFGGWIAPLIIFFLKRQSRFVSFHALEVLLFQAVCLFFEMLALGVVFTAMAINVSFGTSNTARNPSGFMELYFVFFALGLIGFVILWFVKLLLAIVYAIKAGRGEWAEYPVIGRFARRILNIGPGGASIGPQA